MFVQANSGYNSDMTESLYCHWGRKHCIQYTFRIIEGKVPPLWKKRKYYWLVFQSLLFWVPRWTLLSLGKSSVMLLGNLSSMDHCKDSTCTDLIRPYPDGVVNLVQSLPYICMSICMHLLLNYKYSTMNLHTMNIVGCQRWEVWF